MVDRVGHTDDSSTSYPATGRSPVPDGGVSGRTEIRADEKYCSNCGAVITRTAVICPECGVAQQQTETRTPPSPSGRVTSALIGGALGFVVFLIPLVNLLSPFVGGVVAGMLRGSDTKESSLTGVLAHVIASVPVLLFASFYLLFGTVSLVSDPDLGPGGTAVGVVVWVGLFAATFGAFYGLGAVGGALGASLSNREAPE